MGIVSLFLLGLLGAGIVQLVFFAMAVRQKRVDIVDTAWGISFIAAAALMFVSSPTLALAPLTVIALTILWGSRLSWHIYGRWKRSKRQDKRYTALMAKWPASHRNLQIFSRIFLVQALLVAVISLPLAAALYSSSEQLTPALLVGLVIWFVGFAIEAAADRQLKKALKNSDGNTLVSAELWRYSRHPNYFGEITMWWGIAVISFHESTWMMSAVGAATITVLICFVSGIPLAEKSMQSKPGWQAYKKRTSVLVPWVPKR